MNPSAAMPLDHDRPNLERSPAEHDAEAIEPGSTERDVTAIEEALTTFDAPAGPLLDIGCGTGRHLRALRARGHTARGIDLDPAMLAAAREAGTPEADLVHGDICAYATGTDAGRYAACLLLNDGLTCFHSHRLAWGLFQAVAGLLAPGGLFLIGNCCARLWDQIRAADLADGMSLAGDEQLFFLPGENRFVWRRGAAVDPDSWSVRTEDRIYRAWSLPEVALAAAGAGLALSRLRHDSSMIVLQQPDHTEEPACGILP